MTTKPTTRNKQRLERAVCVDCFWITQGVGTVRRASHHATSRQHHVEYMLILASGELRTRRWPAATTTEDR